MTIAVRVLGFIFVKQATILFDQVNGAFFASDLAVLGCEHGHFVRMSLVDRTTLVVVYDGFHGLLVVFTTVIAIYRVTLDVNDTWALAQFSTNLKPLLNLIFIEARSAI